MPTNWQPPKKWKEAADYLRVVAGVGSTPRLDSEHKRFVREVQQTRTGDDRRLTRAGILVISLSLRTSSGTDWFQPGSVELEDVSAELDRFVFDVRNAAETVSVFYHNKSEVWYRD